MRGYFIDIQGTLIDDKNFLPLDGAIEFIDFLNEKNIPFVLVTNNTKKESKEFISYLQNLGFKFNEEYIDPLMIIKKELKDITLKPYGNEKFVEIIKNNFETSNNPEGVILGIKVFTPEEIAEIIELLLNGAKLYGMHKTSLYVKNDKRYPGLGAILEMLKYATGKDYKIFGKPSEKFFNEAKKKIGLSFDKITIISDDLYGDLLPAKNLGMKSVLVLTGKIKNEKEITKKPDFIFRDLKDYLNYLMENEKWKEEN